MDNSFPFLVRRASRALLSVLACLSLAAAGRAGSLDVRVVYEGPGQVDEDHGLIVLALGDDDLGNPLNPILATSYLSANGATARFADLDADQVWLLAVYDEHGGYSATGRLPGPIGIYSEAPDGTPSGVPVSGGSVELRFTDAIRTPQPDDAKPQASFETLREAEGGIVEIRVYRVKAGLREDFVRFFEGTLKAQAAAGLHVAGQFRSLDDENTFVWVRTFRNQKERQERSRAFYLGPAWLEQRRAEAVGLIESTEVMLVEPTARSGIR